ncbi:hypothetical protein [Paraburkholderia sp. SIMBA_054]|uniref:hypothetical protein n=1 Tax=Paraburkholderia sp. SIMBA_054 TaxID=3085795 RepID=UPI00397B3F5A
MNQQASTFHGLRLDAFPFCESPLDIRCGFALASLLGVEDFESFNSVGIDPISHWEHAAEQLGYQADAGEALPPLFVGTSLADRWECGRRDRDLTDFHESQEGTQEEWDALSAEEQSAEWDEFHELCAAGVGERSYYYRILMDRWLVGYVGH